MSSRPATCLVSGLILVLGLTACARAGRPSADATEPPGEADTAPPADHLTQPVGPPPATPAWDGSLAARTVFRVAADPDAGFHWPYFMVLPERPTPGAPLLVQPNNDARPGAPFATHEYWASIVAEQSMIDWGRHLGVATLVPVFPRPVDEGGRNLYVHALVRDAMLADDPALARPDLQLLAMIDDARARLAEAGRTTPPAVLMWGFSAAGDFVTRMTMLHPERVRAVAAGGLGGLPILPRASLDGTRLTYPVGIGDIEVVAERPFAAEAFRRTPVLLLQGGDDENDSVPEGELVRETFWSDSYDFDQSVWVNAAFGRLPVDRVDAVRRVHEDFGMTDFTSRVYPGVEHTTTPAMDEDVRAFFRRVLAGDGLDVPPAPDGS